MMGYKYKSEENRIHSPHILEGLRLRLCELRLGGMGREEVLELCGRLYDGEVSGK